MPHSMTAFSRQTRDADWGSLQLELRSVNQRYLEPHFRLPDTLRDLEPQVTLPEATRRAALIPLEKMLELSA